MAKIEIKVTELNVSLNTLERDIVTRFLNDDSVSDLAEDYCVNCLAIEESLRQIISKCISLTSTVSVINEDVPSNGTNDITAKDIEDYSDLPF